MSTQRFAPEFEEEAVKQVIDTVPDIAGRLGVSAYSLYKWVKAASPDRSEQQAPAGIADSRAFRQMSTLGPKRPSGN